MAYRWNGIKLIDKNNKKEQFINANWIASPLVENETKQFIATQGPMVNTCSHFWQMVHQTNSKLVIAIIENEVIGSKCYAYWPRSDALVFGDWKVNSLDKQTNDLLINRKLNMANKSDGVNWELNHLHLYNWKDHQIVSNEFYDGYIDLLEMIWLTRQKHPNNPIIVHCSAGIGRTGTLISSYYLYEKFKMSQSKNEVFKFSVFEIVRHIREQRMGAVQTFGQYQFLYQIVKHFK